jgi:ribosomal protein S18 acetylase RimI-like enzyme
MTGNVEMTTQIKIRPATLQDIEAMTELWIEFVDFHTERDPWFTRSEDGHIRFAEFMTERIKDEKSYVLVAELDGKVVGHAMAIITSRIPVFVPEEYAAIYDVAVSSDHRRSGIGAKLVQEMIRLFQERGLRRVEVGMNTTNEVATAFWRKMGFVPYNQKSWLSIDES